MRTKSEARAADRSVSILRMSNYLTTAKSTLQNPHLLLASPVFGRPLDRIGKHHCIQHWIGRDWKGFEGLPFQSIGFLTILHMAMLDRN